MLLTWLICNTGCELFLRNWWWVWIPLSGDTDSSNGIWLCTLFVQYLSMEMCIWILFVQKPSDKLIINTMHCTWKCSHLKSENLPMWKIATSKFLYWRVNIWNKFYSLQDRLGKLNMQDNGRRRSNCVFQKKNIFKETSNLWKAIPSGSSDSNKSLWFSFTKNSSLT